MTKRHWNSVTTLRLLRDGAVSIVDEDRELAMKKCTVKRTNLICDHINEWIKRKQDNTTNGKTVGCLDQGSDSWLECFPFRFVEARCSSAFFCLSS